MHESGGNFLRGHFVGPFFASFLGHIWGSFFGIILGGDVLCCQGLVYKFNSIRPKQVWCILEQHQIRFSQQKVYTDIMLERDQYVLQHNNILLLVVTVQQYEVCVLTLVNLIYV